MFLWAVSRFVCFHLGEEDLKYSHCFGCLDLKIWQKESPYHSKGWSVRVDKRGLFEKIVKGELNEKTLESLILVDNVTKTSSEQSL